MCSRVAASCAYATGEWAEGRSQSLYQGVKPGLSLPLDRLQNDKLVGHHMVVNSYQEYEDQAVRLGKDMTWKWEKISSQTFARTDSRLNQRAETTTLVQRQAEPSAPSSFYPSREHPTNIFVPKGLLVRLRKHLFLNRDHVSLFDTRAWVGNLEEGMEMAMQKWAIDYQKLQQRNQFEISLINRSVKANRIPREPLQESRCLWI